MDTEVFRPLVDNLRYDDPFLVLADYASYIECQDRVSTAWQDTSAWTRMSILNTARRASSRQTGPSQSIATRSGTSCR
jgi:starch phosphorylase